MPADSSATSTSSLDRVADFVSFASVGVVGLVQDLTHAVIDDIGDLEGSDSELVAEETLCLVATATARSAEVGLKEEPEHASAASTSLLQLPYTYRDYLVGRAMISTQNPELAELGEQVRERLHRKQEFYQSHLPEGRFPGPGALGDKMELWMGRVSPPKLPESPQERLAKLDLVDPLVAHCKLILAYGRRGQVPSADAE
jgi:hypothetical protein